MITVKATQQPQEKPERARFLFGDAEKYSRLPLVFVLLLGSIVAYLKSALPGGGESAASEPESPPQPRLPDEHEAAPRVNLVGAPDDDPPSEASEEEPAEDAAAPARRSSGSALVVPLFTNEVLHFDAAPIDFSGEIPRFPAETRPVYGYTPVNDNFVLGGGYAAGFGGSGGGRAGSSAPATTDTSAEPETEEPPPANPPRRNRAPTSTGPIKLADVFAGQVTLIALSELLLNTVDADADELIVTDLQASMGQLRFDGGAWTYQAGFSARGEVTFTFKVSDGEAAVVQQATFSVIRNPLVEGTEDDDLLVGTPDDDEIDARDGDDLVEAGAGDDVISGGSGDDHIVAGAGNDVVFAGAGNDVVFAGAGNDVVFGEAGDDRIFGEAGDDTLDGGEGADLLFGGEGNDVLLGGLGDDELDGGEGDDLLDGGDGNDILLASAGDDVIVGGLGEDRLEGGDGNDRLIDGAGADIVEGGEGDDVFIVSIDVDEDAFRGGNGRDTLDLSLTSLGVEIDLDKGRIEGLEVGRDSISGFESVKGGRGDDVFIVGGNIATVLEGGDGDDTFVFSTSSMSADTVDQLVHEILDLMVGDRLLVSNFELTEREREDFDDKFDRAYAAREDDANPYPLRIRYERYDDADHTIIDVDFDGNHDYELSIDIAGTYRPFVYDTQEA